jgi:hypothetical protein
MMSLKRKNNTREGTDDDKEKRSSKNNISKRK